MWVTLSLRKKELKQEHAYYQLQDLQLSRQKRQLDRRKRYEQSLIQLNQKKDLAPVRQKYEEKLAELNCHRQQLSDYLAAVKALKGSNAGDYTVNNGAVYQKSDSGNYISVTGWLQESSKPDSSGNYEGFQPISNFELSNDEAGVYYVKGQTDKSGITYEGITENQNAPQRYAKLYELPSDTDYLQELGLNVDLDNISSITDEDLSSIESTVNSQRTAIETAKQELQTERMSEENSVKEYYENELEFLENEVGEEETRLELEQNDIETQMEYVSTELQAITQAVSQDMQNSVIQLK